MHLHQVKSLKWYFNIYKFVASNRLKKNDIDFRAIHTHLVMVLTTGLLMWGYAFLAMKTISSPVPGIVGYICSLVHLLSPMLFRFTNRISLPVNAALLAGVTHQGTFAYYTGGFTSNILIWYGIIPMLGGVCNGMKGVITWTIITTSISVVALILYLTGYKYPYLITHEGFLWAQALLVLGWIFLSSTIVSVYCGLREYTEKLLGQQGKKIDDLFRVLFHDLANPLGRLSIGLSIAKRSLPEGEKNRGLEISELAADSMLDITQNIRKMYAVRTNQASVDLSLSPLNAAIEYVQKIYATELEKKKISIDYDFKKHAALKLLVEPISFKNQVMGNLIHNAIKFSPQSSSIKIQVTPDNHNSFIIEVSDKGIGIPPNLLKELFDINSKTSRPGTNGEHGSGFGMNIMKSFVDMYHGEVKIESVENSGTTVRLKLKGEWS